VERNCDLRTILTVNFRPLGLACSFDRAGRSETNQINVVALAVFRDFEEIRETRKPDACASSVVMSETDGV